MGLFGFFFGDGNRDRARRDQYRPATFGKNLISPVNDYGTCFACEGTGSRTLVCSSCAGSGQRSTQCGRCNGTGTIARPDQICFRCHGTGLNRGLHCTRCYGTGYYRRAVNKPCDECAATGTRTKPCRKCANRGSFVVPCKKCGGSGWYRFPQR